ncbi:MAG: TIGR04442 family protein, partial [Deltaproteobacteria bacterium]|nr:TIGR04442 family protein [Deltaproteobacteria bacterium]
LKLTGKTLKYTTSIERGDDTALIAELNADLDGYNPTIFLFRIIHRFNKRYYDLFQDLYQEDKQISADGEKLLLSLAEEFKIGQYQQERIKLDVTYNHPENKRVVDEYKDVLISFENVEELNRADIASLNRLRALAIKNNIPHYLFDLLDEVLLKGKKLIHGDEPEYINDSRALLDGLFSLEKGGLDAVMDKDDIVKLLQNKKQSMENRDYFDGLLLEVGKTCDESFEKGDTMAFERFSELITYFDRFDTTSSAINHIAFMSEDVSVEKLRSLIGNMRAFDDIKKDLFKNLFVIDLLENKYLTYTGRKKVISLFEGITAVDEGYKSLSAVSAEIEMVNQEDQMYALLYKTAKERLDKIPGAMNGKDAHDGILKEVLKSLLHSGPVEQIPKKIMKKVFTSLKMEGFYTYEILPEILANGDMAMREDFLKNSGFDRFFIEDIERLYIEHHKVPPAKAKNFKDLIEQTNIPQEQ